MRPVPDPFRTPLDLQSRLLYRDALMLVLDKPAGVPVHRGPKGDRPGEINLEQFFGQLTFGLPRNPALAHRLDKDTSGCLVLGRHRKALEQLGLMFKQGKISKTYWAVVEGGPEGDEGLIDKPLGRRDASRGWWMKHDEEGLPSQTRWRVLGRGVDPAIEPAAGMACARTPDRPHPSAQGSYGGRRLAHPRRPNLRLGAARRRADAASSCAGDRRADLQEPGSGEGGSTRAGAHARAFGGMRLDG